VRPLVGLGAVALVLVLPACAGSKQGSGWRTFHRDGVTVRYPHKWFATAHHLTPVSSPRQAIAVASYRLPGSSAGADGCQPKEALDRLPPRGVFIFGWEYGRLSTYRPLRVREMRTFTPRPTRFKLVGFTRSECLGPSYMLRFRDGGRAFQVHVAFGKRADAASRAIVLRILDSFRAKAV
jgi:hypothetical protein